MHCKLSFCTTQVQCILFPQTNYLDIFKFTPLAKRKTYWKAAFQFFFFLMRHWPSLHEALYTTIFQSSSLGCHFTSRTKHRNCFVSAKGRMILLILLFIKSNIALRKPPSSWSISDSIRSAGLLLPPCGSKLYQRLYL